MSAIPLTLHQQYEEMDRYFDISVQMNHNNPVMAPFTVRTRKVLKGWIQEEYRNEDKARILSGLLTNDRKLPIGATLEYFQCEMRFVSNLQSQQLLCFTSFSQEQLMFLNFVFSALQESGVLPTDKFWKLVAVANGSHPFFLGRPEHISKFWLCAYLNQNCIIGTRLFHIFSMFLFLLWIESRCHEIGWTEISRVHVSLCCLA